MRICEILLTLPRESYKLVSKLIAWGDSQNKGSKTMSNKNAFCQIRQLSKALAETRDEEERERIQDEIDLLEDELEEEHSHFEWDD